ncbi:cytochrome P450 [Stieleria sp. TO1_6]|uniref:cytochrome P450 n=1 Tax=Stieleria tagensis TaxID=2956795 RepID=UPI00209BA56D|nr:cytochrome P450 [Stieleria tagensis]MCO8123508.1 cytochrome P450 [Stieleria tagensis]
MSVPKTLSVDPFQNARRNDGVMQCPFNGELITMLLRHADVKSAAADWETFSSDAPFRVPIPREEEVRTMRQLPIETDPPEHTKFRALTEPFFRRAKQPEVIAAIESLTRQKVLELIGRPEWEATADLALPIQSEALTHLLNVPATEARIWMDWGVHVFKVTSGTFKKGNVLEEYLHERFDLAQANPGDDFFSALVTADVDGRPLTRDECMGFANLAFAGGRDTIIHTLTSIVAFFGWKPEALEYLREDPRRIVLASEEFFRVYMPLTQIGRVCPTGAEIHGVTVPPDHRIGLCWASANHDETVFENPEEIRLDRRPNPHVSFGYRQHLCQGAAHARLVVRSFLQTLVDEVARIEILEAVPGVEREIEYSREIGYDTLRVRMESITQT